MNTTRIEIQIKEQADELTLMHTMFLTAQKEVRTALEILQPILKRYLVTAELRCNSMYYERSMLDGTPGIVAAIYLSGIEKLSARQRSNLQTRINECLIPGINKGISKKYPLAGDVLIYRLIGPNPVK